MLHKLKLSCHLLVLHTGAHRPQTTDHRPQTTGHRPQTTDHRPQTTDLHLGFHLSRSTRGRGQGYSEVSLAQNRISITSYCSAQTHPKKNTKPHQKKYEEKFGNENEKGTHTKTQNGKKKNRKKKTTPRTLPCCIRGRARTTLDNSNPLNHGALPIPVAHDDDLRLLPDPGSP